MQEYPTHIVTMSFMFSSVTMAMIVQIWHMPAMRMIMMLRKVCIVTELITWRERRSRWLPRRHWRKKPRRSHTRCARMSGCMRRMCVRMAISYWGSAEWRRIMIVTGGYV